MRSDTSGDFRAVLMAILKVNLTILFQSELLILTTCQLLFCYFVPMYSTNSPYQSKKLLCADSC